jgi:hypothetical protein
MVSMTALWRPEATLWRAVLALLVAGCSPTLRGDQVSVSVFDSSSGRPLSGATVLVAGEDGPAAEADTDAEGKAAFAGLRPGAYWLRVEKSGYVDLLDPRGQGRPVVVPPADKTPLAVGLTGAVAISGQVFDSQGQPLQGGKVVAIVRRSVHGESRFTALGEAGHTDDMGGYRLHGLPPGHYSVALVPAGEDTSVPVFAPVFYPGVSGPGRAVFFELNPGETRTSVNLTAAGPDAPSISGKVSGMPAGASQSRAAVALATRGGLRIPIAAVLTDADGVFVIPNAPPGEYQLTAWAPFAGWEPDGPPAANARTAVRSVSVSGAGLQADLELQPLARVSGRLVWNGGASSGYPCSGGKQIVFRSEDGWLDVWAPAVAVNGDRFTVEGLPAGRYAVEMPGLGNSCRLTTLRVGDHAAPGGVARIDGSAPLTLVLTAATGELSGTVAASDAKPPRGIVVLTPADGDCVAQVAQIDAGGHYRFGQVLAGEYRLIALDGLNSADYLDPQKASDRGAQSVVMEAGRKLTFDLRLVRQ